MRSKTLGKESIAK